MPLGTKDFHIIKGDCVKVLSGKRYQGRLILPGTTARVSYVFKSNRDRFRLAGYTELRFDESEIELVSYVRKGKS